MKHRCKSFEWSVGPKLIGQAGKKHPIEKRFLFKKHEGWNCETGIIISVLLQQRKKSGSM